jgi:hypothetical protein
MIAGSMLHMQAMDRKLDELPAEMNGATGDRKIEAMAKVINELAAERKEMREAMMPHMTNGMRAR